MSDWTEDASGSVIGGSRESSRVFSEYWTFIRTIERPAVSLSALEGCPSCGAPASGIAETGICAHCEARVSGGRFDWVLSRIAQDEEWSA